MGNVKSKKSKEIVEKLDLKGESSRKLSGGGSNSNGNVRKSWKKMKLDQVDEEMIDQVYEVLKKAGTKDGTQDVEFLRRYVKQQLKSTDKGKAVLDELGENRSEELPARGVTFQRSTNAVGA